ncbi:uncharacterized protein H6S33_012796 [Morchella sextelata]|uniref:uncharacterized protein n=1 Tax=Morchella sextelata TaxID=1174677 RepID=UPI001D04C371|nr:uncharacterized protein H6S33_012796 [Morchella sextelata]KAH0609310.1 hypothetical protein H6S33_012796 [Morchella sextelata]
MAPRNKVPTPINTRLLSRLHNDYKDLVENPYPGIHMIPHEQNLRNFCLVLAPQSGPFLGLRLHFAGRLPETWPADPPVLTSSAYIRHPNIHGRYVCSDLLRHEQYGAPEGYVGGYTPAFTLKGLFIQFLSFFSSEQVIENFLPPSLQEILSKNNIADKAILHKQVEQEHGPSVYIGGRFQKIFVPTGEFQSIGIATFVLSNDSPASTPGRFDDDAAYMAEFEAGGRKERVLERLYTSKGRESLVTVWRPNANGPFANVKITRESKRFLETRSQSRQFTCKECGYGTPSMSRTVPVKVPKEYMDQDSPFREEMVGCISANERELVKLKRKLRPINALKERKLAGEHLQGNQICKLATYDDLAEAIRKVEADIAKEPPPPPPPKLPEAKKQSPSKGKICYLGDLHDDVLLAIVETLPSESLISFGKAFPRIQELTTHHHILLQRELRCFFLRTPLHTPSNLLGVGVHIDEKTGMLESSFDWLSMDAFEKFKVRKSVDKKEFEFFLPLGFSPAHFDRAYSSKKLFEYIDLIDAKNTKKRGVSGPGNTLFALNGAERRMNVLYRFCNSIVVSLMRATDELYSGGAVGDEGKAGKTLLFASEKACIGYLQIYHLLLCIMRQEPELRKRAVERIKAFCADDQNRSKSSVPDLGEFIVMAAVVAGSDKSASAGTTTLAPFNGGRKAEAEEGWIIAGQKKRQLEKTGSSISWRKDLVGPFTDEVFTRNARWAIQKYPILANKYSVDPSQRIRKSFDASRTSLRLVMFQVFFLETFTAEHITRQMDSQYGFAGPEVPAMITRGIKEIYEVNGYKQFCERVGFKGAVGGEWWPEAMSRVLLSAVERSEMKGYHRAHRERP